MKRYWVMKTRADADRKDYVEHYYKFIDPKENNGHKVIAIGWRHGPKNGKASLNDLVKFMRKYYYKEGDKRAEKRAQIAAKTVSTFIHEMQVDDEVLLCKGFTPKQKQPVMVYAFCRIVGTYWEHKKCRWFKRKRNAEYEHIIERKVDKKMLSYILGRGSLLKTIHKIDEEHFQLTKSSLLI